MGKFSILIIGCIDCALPPEDVLLDFFRGVESMALGLGYSRLFNPIFGIRIKLKYTLHFNCYLELLLSEDILGVIGETEAKINSRWMSKWALLFTSNRVIAAKVAGTMSLVGSVFDGYLGDMQKAKIEGKIQELSEDAPILSVEQVLNEDEDNFAIPLEEIDGIEMKKGGLLSSYKIILNTKDKDYSFNLIDRGKFDEYTEMVKTIYPEKLS